ncbi:MAG TPA: GNAT family protein, partial [Parvularculaceae bacterium]|nr:GNAT family protein [Parvularculaceae bacterium]
VRAAELADAEALTAMLADPAVSAPVYTLPKPITLETVAAFIARHLEEREAGRGLLLIGLDEIGAVAGYHDIQIWPEWAASELGGAIRPDRQSAGAGGPGAAAAFDWLFEVIGVDLICETAALDNIRTARLLERIGFVSKGEIESALPGGGARASRYWELTRGEWQARRERT